MQRGQSDKKTRKPKRKLRRKARADRNKIIEDAVTTALNTPQNSSTLEDAAHLLPSERDWLFSSVSLTSPNKGKIQKHIKDMLRNTRAYTATRKAILAGILGHTSYQELDVARIVNTLIQKAKADKAKADNTLLHLSEDDIAYVLETRPPSASVTLEEKVSHLYRQCTEFYTKYQKNKTALSRWFLEGGLISSGQLDDIAKEVIATLDYDAIVKKAADVKTHLTKHANLALIIGHYEEKLLEKVLSKDEKKQMKDILGEDETLSKLPPQAIRYNLNKIDKREVKKRSVKKFAESFNRFFKTINSQYDQNIQAIQAHLTTLKGGAQEITPEGQKIQTAIETFRKTQDLDREILGRLSTETLNFVLEHKIDPSTSQDIATRLNQILNQAKEQVKYEDELMKSICLIEPEENRMNEKFVSQLNLELHNADKEDDILKDFFFDDIAQLLITWKKQPERNISRFNYGDFYTHCKEFHQGYANNRDHIKRWLSEEKINDREDATLVERIPDKINEQLLKQINKKVIIVLPEAVKREIKNVAQDIQTVPTSKKEFITAFGPLIQYFDHVGVVLYHCEKVLGEELSLEKNQQIERMLQPHKQALVQLDVKTIKKRLSDCIKQAAVAEPEGNIIAAVTKFCEGLQPANLDRHKPSKRKGLAF